MKYIVTMTSYPKRIKFVKQQIDYFFKNTTVKPDMFYLWLSESEFFRKERDLPSDLMDCINHYGIQLRWCKNNEYCHKRWYVYPEHMNDVVICIDDDHYYPNDMIETVKNLPITRTVYNIFSNYTYPTIYENIKFYQFTNAFDNTPSKYKTFNGQCVFMPNTFPIESISPENIKIRQKYCPICDESWLMPFIKYHDIDISSLGYMSNEIIYISEIGKTFDKLSKTIFHTLTLKDVQLYIVLRQFPELKKKWESLYPSYKSSYFDNKIDINELFNLLMGYMFNG